MKTTERVVGFDLARVVAIFIIIGIYHNLGYAGRFHAEPAVRVLVYSSLGVFTFLSAFLLASKYSFTEEGEILSFYKKRVLRVYPLFVVSSLILAFLGFNSWGTTIKGVLGISPFWAPHPTTMWYVAMLISLYIITPFVVHGSVKQQCLKAFIIMTVVGLVHLFLGTVVSRTFNYYTVYLIGLLLGMNYYEATKSFLQSRKTFLISLVWLMLVVVVYLNKSVYLKSFSSVIGIIAIINVSMIVADRFQTNKSFTKAVAVLSYSSFCAYLFHREVIWALFRIYRPKGFFPVFFEVLFIAVPLSFLCAYCIQRAYDALLRRFEQ